MTTTAIEQPSTETCPAGFGASAESFESLKHSKDKRYFDLMAYIVSNTISGEIMAVENYSEMVPIMPNTDAKIETVKQATEESKHIKMLASLGKRLNYPVKTEIVEPQWRNIRNIFSQAVRKKDLASCLIIQDLMTETMAIVLYRVLCRDTDPETTQVAGLILEDELEHLEIGINRIKAMIAEDSDGVHDSLIWAHHKVMPELFSMISTSCHALCGELQVDCGGIGLDSIRTDIEALRVEALDTYMETLEKVGFDDKVTMPLIAGMSSYGVQPKGDISLRSDAAPSSCGTGDVSTCGLSDAPMRSTKVAPCC
ncbi:MAG: long-chain fatty aldehyde decarbonylase [Burkholderiales bacterium]|nr:long-chain fatty aldehyde decarbonylase [Burkholderiales bacterium]